MGLPFLWYRSEMRLEYTAVTEREKSLAKRGVQGYNKKAGAIAAGKELVRCS